MPTSVIYPKVNLELASGTIANWLVSEGEQVSAGQLLFEIENDKATVEVEAAADGTIHDLTPEGQEVDVGAPVARIFAPDEAYDAAPKARETAVEAVGAEIAQVSAPLASAVSTPTGTRHPNPTPLARRIAQSEGLSLEGLAGTGPRGRVQKKDVVAALAARALAEQVTAARAEPVQTRGAAAAKLNTRWLRKGQGHPVVLLHGFSADLNGWRAFLSGTRQSAPVLAIDLPNHGKSARLDVLSLDVMADLIEQTLEAEGVETCVLAGHSLGAALATHVAARHQIDVRGLCLFAPAGLCPEIDSAFVQGVLRAQSAQSLRPWLERLVFDPAHISDAFVETVAKQREDQDLTAAMQRVADAVFADGTQCFTIRDQLNALRVPVRVVFGRQDAVIPFRATQALPAQAGLHAVDQCGHMPQLEHPELSARILDELYRSI